MQWGRVEDNNKNMMGRERQSQFTDSVNILKLQLANGIHIHVPETKQQEDYLMWTVHQKGFQLVVGLHQKEHYLTLSFLMLMYLACWEHWSFHECYWIPE